ncbi:MAG TPA: hypothetical protein VM165_15340, partial [Planctomycetaceae bacterium]|nr:hypothetical protein [Planctomycetaceae bacterium]
GSAQAEPIPEPRVWEASKLEATFARERLFVTPLPTISLECRQPRVLLAGTDSLDFGVYVDFDRHWPKILTRLAQLKRKAKGNAGKIIADGRCAILPGGKPNFPFHFQYPGFQLFLSRKRQPDGNTPNVFVRLNSEFLWHHGERSAIKQVLAALAELAGGTVRECRMSRCDLAVDVWLPERLTDGFLRSHAVTRTRSMRLYLEGDDLQTLYVGAADGDVQLRCYDKSAEIVHSSKDWFLPLWGLTVNFGVWRFEFQVRRAMLKSCGINSLDDLLTKRGDLWRYLTEEWFLLRLPDNANVTRRTPHPLWQMVQGCVERFGPVTEPLQRRKAEPATGAEPLRKQLANKVVSFSARNQIVNLQEALQDVNQALTEEFAARNFTEECQRKAIKLGITLREGRDDSAA